MQKSAFKKRPVLELTATLALPQKALLWASHPCSSGRHGAEDAACVISAELPGTLPSLSHITKLLLMTSPYKALPNLRHSNVGASPAALPSPCCALPGAASPKTPRYCSWCLACCLQPSLPLQITVSSTLAGPAPSAHLDPHKCNWHVHKSLWPASMCPCPPVNHQLAGPWAPWVAFRSWGRCAKK